MEISNGFIRTLYGNWLNLKYIEFAYVEHDTIYLSDGDVQRSFSEHHWALSRHDNEVQAQSELDKLMRSKWN